MKQEKTKGRRSNAEQAYEKRRRRWYRNRHRRSLLKWTSALFLAVAIAVPVLAAALPVVRVIGSSMEPTLKKGEVLLTVRSAHPKRGEIWAFLLEDRILLRRVIGLEGDEIDLDETGRVWVNSELLEQGEKSAYLGQECDVKFPCTVPEGTFFVLGDDRAHSLDSRSSAMGFVPKEKLLGRVIFRLWPWARMGVLK